MCCYPSGIHNFSFMLCSTEVPDPLFRIRFAYFHEVDPFLIRSRPPPRPSLHATLLEFKVWINFLRYGSLSGKLACTPWRLISHFLVMLSLAACLSRLPVTGQPLSQRHTHTRRPNNNSNVARATAKDLCFVKYNMLMFFQPWNLACCLYFCFENMKRINAFEYTSNQNFLESWMALHASVPDNQIDR